MEWPAELIDSLARLWDEGLSTAEIGRRLGVSKNAVVGKAHRLDLPPRPSPITGTIVRRLSPPPPKRVRKKPTLPSLAAQPAFVAPKREIKAARAAVPSIEMASRQFTHGRECQFPIGAPRTSAFRFCGKPVTTPGPYCNLHRDVCYSGTVWRADRDETPDLLADRQA